MASLIIVGLVLLWVGAVAFFRTQRVWLLYYVLGAVGSAFLLVYILEQSGAGAFRFQAATAYGTHYVANVLGIPTRIFESAPDRILVLVIAQDIGWTSLYVGTECSGLLETAILMGLLAFYPGWDLRRKASLIGVGVIATYVANIVRMLLIIAILHWMGKDWLLFAHTLVGKFVFFVLVVIIYWYLLTLPTITHVGRQLATGEGR